MWYILYGGFVIDAAVYYTTWWFCMPHIYVRTFVLYN